MNELNGNVLGYTDTVIGAWSFGYDQLNRLTSAANTSVGNWGMNFCWAYDSFGNRTQQSTSNAAFTTGENGACNTTGSLASPLNTWASYNRQNQVTGTTAAPGGYAYDGAGDVVNDGKNAYLYDAEGRICAVTNGTAGPATCTTRRAIASPRAASPTRTAPATSPPTDSRRIQATWSAHRASSSPRWMVQATGFTPTSTQAASSSPPTTAMSMRLHCTSTSTTRWARAARRPTPRASSKPPTRACPSAMASPQAVSPTTNRKPLHRQRT